MDKMQWARGLFPFLATVVLMTSASVLSSDHKNSKSSGVLDVAVNSNVAGQNTAAVPSPSSLSMPSSKVFHSSTLAISSSSFAVLSAKMAKKLSTPALPLALSKLVTYTVVVSTSDVPSSALSRSDSSSAMSSSLITEQECYNYKVLNEPSRSKTYDGPGTDECDDMLSVDWYRFSGGAGNKMAESCVDMYHCKTNIPGWLNGSHPTVNEGAVQRGVCFRAYSDCCWSATLIRVRNCGGFYVYQLKPVIGCFIRYCGNGNVSSTPMTAELPHTTTTNVTPATGAPSTTEPKITPTQLPQTTTKVTPATGTPSTTDPEITPTQLPHTTTTKVTPATGAPSTTDPEITTTQLPQTTTTKVTPATGTPRTTDHEITPKRAMNSELENRSIVVVDIDKEIIGRRGSIRQKSCSK